MVRIAVIPFGKPGMISAAMLGLGRALGETIAVALVLSATFHDQLAHHRARRQHLRRQHRAERGTRPAPIGLGALIASGLVLFVITLLVNMVARLVIERRARVLGGELTWRPRPHRTAPVDPRLQRLAGRRQAAALGAARRASLAAAVLALLLDADHRCPAGPARSSSASCSSSRSRPAGASRSRAAGTPVDRLATTLVYATFVARARPAGRRSC